MEEKRINTIVTEESIVESLHKQLDNNEFSMLEKALKAFGQSKSDVSDIDILIDCTSEELQSVNYCELTEKFLCLWSDVHSFPAIRNLATFYNLDVAVVGEVISDSVIYRKKKLNAFIFCFLHHV